MRNEDIKIFIDGIENPAEPNQALKDAAERYIAGDNYNRYYDDFSKQETLEEAAKRLYSDKEYPMYGEIRRDGFINGAKWQQEQIGKSEFLQRLRGTLSDAEARRLIFETFKNK
jgi:hypothetical protein